MLILCLRVRSVWCFCELAGTHAWVLWRSNLHSISDTCLKFTACRGGCEDVWGLYTHQPVRWFGVTSGHEFISEKRTVNIHSNTSNRWSSDYCSTLLQEAQSKYKFSTPGWESYIVNTKIQMTCCPRSPVDRGSPRIRSKDGWIGKIWIFERGSWTAQVMGRSRAVLWCFCCKEVRRCFRDWQQVPFSFLSQRERERGGMLQVAVTGTFFIGNDHFVKCFEGSGAPGHQRMTTLRKSAEKLKSVWKIALVGRGFYSLSDGRIAISWREEFGPGVVVNNPWNRCSFGSFITSLEGIRGIDIPSALHKLHFKVMLRTIQTTNLWVVLRENLHSAGCHMFPMDQGTKWIQIKLTCYMR